MADLKSQKSSLERAIRYLAKSRDEARGAMAAVKADAGGVGLLEALAVKMELLKSKCADANVLLTTFEQTAAEGDDTTYQDCQTQWGDELYETEELLAEGRITMARARAGPHVDTSFGAVAATSPGQTGEDGTSVSGAGSVMDQISRLLTLMERQQVSSQAGQPGQGQVHSDRVLYSKLPELKLPKFGGDLLKWKTFWDRFEASVDKNPKLAPVDKLSYLLSLLEKEALMVVENLPITNENYDTAKALLTSKYGDPKMVIALLYRRLNEMKPVNNEAGALRRFVAEIDCLLGSLGSMGQDTSDDNFATIILSKLPRQVVVLLEMSKEVDDPWTVTRVRSKLTDYLVRLERADKVSAMSRGTSSRAEMDFTADSLFAGDNKAFQGSRKRKGKKKPNSGGSQTNGYNKDPKCVFCEGNHYADQCEKFTTADDRVKQLGSRCLICLNEGHQKSACRSKKQCYYCKVSGSHHSALCYKKFGRNSGQENSHVALTDPGQESEANDEEGSSLLATGEGVTLQTARISVKTSVEDANSFVVVRALFDPGANRSYCSTGLAYKLGIRMESGPALKVNRFGSDIPISIPTKTGNLLLRKLDGTLANLEVSIIPKITGRLTRSAVHSKKLEGLKSRLTLADEIPAKDESTPVELLIGNDYYLDLITGDKIHLEGGLYLLGSEFGYILSGRCAKPSRGSYYAMAMCAFTYGSVPELNDFMAIPKVENPQLKVPEISDFWSLETLGIKDDPEVSSDDLVVKDFEENVTFERGRYSVSLPWNDRAGELQDNYNLSVGRLRSLVKRMGENDELFSTYNGIIKDQLEKGVIEKVASGKVPKGAHYIPHHAVIEPQRETTKVRVVYDGSAKTRGDLPSLNESLHRGPVLLEDLAGLLIRFRTHKYAIIADIEKAFLQIGIHEKDRDKLRFVWLNNPERKTVDGNIQIFRFCRVVFGLNCSPALLALTVKHHLKSVGSEVALQIIRDIYADNVLTGVDSLEEAETFYAEAKGIFKKACMNLRQWASNCAELMEMIPTEDRINVPVPKVMGLQWERQKDELSISENFRMKQKAQTKREFLSQVSAVYDPLGLFSPVTVTGKVMLQKMCESKPTWDEKMAESVISAWEEERKKLMEVPAKSVPRYIPLKGKCTLVTFCDASESSFATTVYLRSDFGGKVAVNLIMSKSRLNPVKKLTIPRAELMGIVIGVRATVFVAKCLNLSIDNAVIFSDSNCALAWLESKKKQDVFVKNRVREIAKKGGSIAFRYVNTEENPADWATKGKKVAELDSFWWQGPDWITKPESQWPTWGYEQFRAKEAEIRDSPLIEMSLPACSTAESVLGIEPEKFSSHLTLLRVTAWCLRFVDTTRKMGTEGSGTLTAGEINRARSKWEKVVQAQAYHSVKGAIRAKKAHHMAHLGVFEDPTGILRCKGRMEKASVPWETRNPIILPKGHTYTRLLVLRVHAENGHASVSHTLSLVRQTYWIPKGRQLIKSVIHNCIRCRKAIGNAYARPEMPELPTDRVVPQPCFTKTGLDYFGPLKLKSENGVAKSWVALFTCLVTRAVHLELVMDMTAEEFLMALRRFIARRGQPDTIISDNATQFKAVAKFAEINWGKIIRDSAVADFSSGRGIQWTYIVEHAPYMGGVYERLVGVVKSCLRKTLGPALLSPKQFETALCECEAIVNTRPLAYVGSDLDGTVLTPAHFLSVNPRVAIPQMVRKLAKDGDHLRLETPTLGQLVDNWRKGERLLNEFWARWKTEYLGALRERITYRHRRGKNSLGIPKVGEIVVLKEKSLPRGSWKIAKISEIHAGADGQIRSVTVFLPSGRSVRRPVDLIIPLECESDTKISPPGVDSESDTIPTLADRTNNGVNSGRASPELIANETGTDGPPSRCGPITT